MRLAPALLAFAAAALAPPSLARAVPPPARALHLFGAITLSPDGRHLASIETDDIAAEIRPPVRLLIRDLDGGAVTVALPCAGRPGCVPSSPSWSADGRQLAFLLEQPDGATTTIESVGADGGPPRRVLAFPGPLEQLAADRKSVV